jgi:type I restriction enzyme S subunit
LTEWQEVNLGQVVEILSSKRVFASDYTIEGVPFWRGKEVVELSAGRSITTELYIAEKTYQFLGRKIGFPKKDDILLTSVGTLGRAYKLTDEDRIYFKDGNLTWFRNYSERLDPSWLLYWMRSDIGQGSFEQTKIGSTQQALTIVNLKSLKVALPPLLEQRAIAATLGALDDKIELNRRMNETLEAMARALFRDWFVDFGPTRAKMAGTAPYLSPDLWSLFPDRLDDAGMPKGWEEKILGEIVDLRKGRNITRKTVIPGDVPVVAGGLSPAYFHNTPNVIGPVITASASGANAGFIRLYHQDIWASDCSFISQEQTAFLFSIYALLSSRQDEIYTMQQGAAQPHIYPSDLKRMAITDAPKPVWQALEKLLASMFELVASNELKSRTLAQTRDLLLPRLMSGELRVAGAERTVEAVL